jgi:3-dehydroquinate dehydratase-2
MKKILVLHDCNLNLLGQHGLGIYGQQSQADTNEQFDELAQPTDVSLTAFQRNCEATFINATHQAYPDQINSIVINHTTDRRTRVALRNALAAVRIPFIDVHIGNSYTRHSDFSDLAVGVISGLSGHGYVLGLQPILNTL